MKTYRCICHVCGKEFDHQSEFLSTGATKTVDGRQLAVTTCTETRDGRQHLVHHPADIRASYEAGGFYGKEPKGVTP